MILPKKIDIDKAKASERKIQIDEGVALAKKIDFLRETALKEEKNLFEWRENNLNKVKYEIGQFIEERDNLEKQNNEARQIRDALLKPDVKQVQTELKIMVNTELEKRGVYLSGEVLKEEEKKLMEEKEKISQISAIIKKQQDETEKAKSETISLKEMARREYEIAKEERTKQTETVEKALFETHKREREYEIALSTVEFREKEIKEKEVDIIKREKHLASQQQALKIVMEEIKKNGTS